MKHLQKDMFVGFCLCFFTFVLSVLCTVYSSPFASDASLFYNMLCAAGIGWRLCKMRNQQKT